MVDEDITVVQVRKLSEWIFQHGTAEHTLIFQGILKSHEKYMRESTEAWDAIGSALQTPSDTISVPEYRRQVIQLIQDWSQRRTDAIHEEPVQEGSAALRGPCAGVSCDSGAG